MSRHYLFSFNLDDISLGVDDDVEDAVALPERGTGTADKQREQAPYQALQAIEERTLSIFNTEALQTAATWTQEGTSDLCPRKLVKIREKNRAAQARYRERMRVRASQSIDIHVLFVFQDILDHSRQNRTCACLKTQCRKSAVT